MITGPYKFCILEKDKKTFQYFKLYFNNLEKNKQCYSIDNEITFQEIRNHLITNNITNDNHINEIEKWINENGEPFRIYLNTIKLVYLACKIMNKNWDDINWNEFCRIEDIINKLKKTCLDTIF